MACVFLHWFNFVATLTWLLMRSRICLLTIPKLLFAGLMSLQGVLLGKLSLWSLIVTYACCLGMTSILSAMPSFDDISFSSLLISMVMDD